MSRRESSLQRIEEKEKDWRTYVGWPGDQRPWNRPCRGRCQGAGAQQLLVKTAAGGGRGGEATVSGGATSGTPTRRWVLRDSVDLHLGLGFSRVRPCGTEMPLNCWRLDKINAPLVWLVGWQAVCPLHIGQAGKPHSGPRPARRNASPVRAPRAHRPPRAAADPRRSRRPELSARPPGRGASTGAARLRGWPARVPPPRRLRPIHQPPGRLEVSPNLPLSSVLLGILLSELSWFTGRGEKLEIRSDYLLGPRHRRKCSHTLSQPLCCCSPCSGASPVANYVAIQEGDPVILPIS